MSEKTPVKRIQITIPANFKEELDEWAGIIGVRRGQFYATALAIGGRSLLRSFAPEKYFNLSPEVFAALVREEIQSVEKVLPPKDEDGNLDVSWIPEGEEPDL